MKPAMRLAAFVVSAVLLAACASQPQRPAGQIDIAATSQGKPLDGADCVARTLSGSWNVQTPGIVNVGEANGDLQVVCNHPGFRTSEVIIRAPATGPGGTHVSVGVGGGFGGYHSGGMSLGFGFPIVPARPPYPAKVVVDMTPLNTSQ